ncbi:MAG TPA: trypsin-like peptidase domain-containing protein [Caldisericia bacterium]|nr:trypsin-like peptidase domain-containing protein [Caldisericia bacterium]HXK51502.1 trypsin-like peptidase domain-containing protein [Caldisericia bacterium]
MSENTQNRYDDRQETMVTKSRVGGIIVGIILFLIGGMIGSFFSVYWIAANPSILPDSPIRTVQMNPSENGQTPVQPTDQTDTDKIVLSHDPIVTVASTVSQSVVKVEVLTQSRYGWQKSGSGSGFIISEDGYLVTNNHVVDGAQMIRVERKNGEKYEAQLIGTDSISDIALIKIEATKLPFLEFEKSENVRVGETVIAIGNPYGYEYTVTRGVVSAVQREISIPEQDPTPVNPFEGMPFFDFQDPFDRNIPQNNQSSSATIPMVGVVQTDAAINPGNSGGPLVNMAGKVIGVNFLIDVQGQGLGFAIDSNTVMKVTKDLKDYGTVSWASLGVVISENNDEVATALKLKVNTGVVVVEVPAGNARKAGILKGDVIMGMDGKSFSNPQALITYIRSKDPGEEVELLINRDGKEMKIKTVLEELRK